MLTREVAQQSHHCGIETASKILTIFFCSVRSNRTIVGLKPAAKAALVGSSASQQSHHCGIETKLVLSGKSFNSRSNRTIVGLKLGFSPHPC